MAKSPNYSNPEVLSRIVPLSLRARRVVEGTITGLHKSPFHGSNVEFSAYREYSPGDDLRRLDWRVYGRSDRHYIKQFEEESNLRATLVVDASRSMQYGGGPLTKFSYAATMVASLATLLVEQQDPVGLALFDRQQHDLLPPASSQAQLHEIIRRLEATTPDRETELGVVLESLAGQLKRRGLIVIVSDLLTDQEAWIEGLSRLQYGGHEIIILHILDRDELEMPFDDSVMFRDIEGTEQVMAEPWNFRGAYRDAMQRFVEDTRRECGNRAVDYRLFVTDEDLGLVLSHFLHARQQLIHRGPSRR